MPDTPAYPMAGPSHLDRFLRRMNRRLWLGRVARCFQSVMYPAGAAAMMILIFQAITQTHLEWIAAGVLTIAWTIGLLLILRCKPTPALTALEIDHRLKSRDLISTARHLQASGNSATDDPWAAAVLHQADRQVRNLQPADILPKPVSGPRTLGWILLQAMVVAGILIHPSSPSIPSHQARFVSIQALQQRIDRPSAATANHAPARSLSFSKNKPAKQTPADAQPLSARPHPPSAHSSANTSQGAGRKEAGGYGTSRAPKSKPTARNSPTIPTHTAQADAHSSHQDRIVNKASGSAQLNPENGTPPTGQTGAGHLPSPAAPAWVGPNGPISRQQSNTLPRLPAESLNAIPPAYRNLVRAFFDRAH